MLAAFHYEPETNGVVEKFIQTLKKQVLWIERLDTLDELGTLALGQSRRSRYRGLDVGPPRL
jgi:hypothetical protein